MVHQYKNNGYNIVMDVNSGSIHVVDDLVYDMIDILSREDVYKRIRHTAGENDTGIASYDEISDIFNEKISGYTEDKVREAYNEICELIKEDILFSEDTYEDIVIDFKKRKTFVKALCLHISHDCNLSCKYCFAQEGEYHQNKRELMSYETGKRALDYLIENSGSRRNLEVDFFGGEPLMNFEVVRRLVEYGRSIENKYDKNLRFTLTTNGVLLNDEILDFANKEMSNLVLSIDGRKEIHDRMRPFRGGQGSYDAIVDKFKKAAESRNQMNYYVRGTFTRHNLDFPKDVMHLADLGFEQISIEPVVAPPEADYSIRKEDVPYILEQYDVLAKELLKRREEGKPVNFFHFMIDLEGGPCVIKRLSGCGSGTEYLSVTPSGELYPCHQFVGNEEFRLGDVWNGIQNTAVRDEFKLCNVYAKEKCRDCFARFYCSGGCAANAYNFSGDINGAYETGCQLQRKRTEVAIMMKAAMAGGINEENTSDDVTDVDDI
ncbi:MAG: thioether cross-link-forming SCIFF peptide maturase [Lachnospiraceae bacterium]|nr:thioether cross-link-forming SCIFF peptide maturase [Lachnospiraceae bacterium]